jgi:hypothetical protein
VLSHVSLTALLIANGDADLCIRMRRRDSLTSRHVSKPGGHVLRCAWTGGGSRRPDTDPGQPAKVTQAASCSVTVPQTPPCTLGERRLTDHRGGSPLVASCGSESHPRRHCELAASRRPSCWRRSCRARHSGSAHSSRIRSPFEDRLATDALLTFCHATWHSRLQHCGVRP